MNNICVCNHFHCLDLRIAVSDTGATVYWHISQLMCMCGCILIIYEVLYELNICTPVVWYRYHHYHLRGSERIKFFCATNGVDKLFFPYLGNTMRLNNWWFVWCGYFIYGFTVTALRLYDFTALRLRLYAHGYGFTAYLSYSLRYH